MILRRGTTKLTPPIDQIKGCKVFTARSHTCSLEVHPIAQHGQLIWLNERHQEPPKQNPLAYETCAHESSPDLVQRASFFGVRKIKRMVRRCPQAR